MNINMQPQTLETSGSKADFLEAKQLVGQARDKWTEALGMHDEGSEGQNRLLAEYGEKLSQASVAVCRGLGVLPNIGEDKVLSGAMLHPHFEGNIPTDVDVELNRYGRIAAVVGSEPNPHTQQEGDVFEVGLIRQGERKGHNLAVKFSTQIKIAEDGSITVGPGEHLYGNGRGSMLQVFVDGRPVLESFSDTTNIHGYEFKHGNPSTTTQVLPDFARERPYTSTPSQEQGTSRPFPSSQRRLDQDKCLAFIKGEIEAPVDDPRQLLEALCE